MRKTRHYLIMALTAAMTLAGAAKASGQSFIVNEGFEGDVFPPSGWTTVDADGDGHCWQIATSGHASLNGKKIAISYTSNPDNGKDYDGTQDNWLITPQINVTNDQFKVSYMCCAEDLNSKEYYELLVSETGTAPADFTHKLTAETLDNGYEDYPEKKKHSFSLKAFKGKKIYIAFRHHQAASYALGIDDVNVSNLAGPKAPTGLTATAGTDGTSVVLKWKNASTTGTENALTAVTAVVYRDGEKIATVSEGMTPGADATYTDTAVPSGNHTYAVAMSTDEGESGRISKTIHVGLDIPAAITDLQAKANDGQITITWKAPTAGANKGTFDPAQLTYTVTRNVGDTHQTIATGLKETTYKDTPTAGQLTSYTVVPVNPAGEGKGMTSSEFIGYGQTLKDFNIAPDATSEYGNPKLPFDLESNQTATQVMVYPSDLKGAKGTISDLVLRNSFSEYADPMTSPMKIWMMETDETSLQKGWFKTTDMTLVFDGDVTFNKGANDVPLHLTTPYSYKGRNLVVYMFLGKGSRSGAYADRFFVAANTDKPNRTRTVSSSSSNIDLDNIASGEGTGFDAALPYMRFIIDATGVATLSGKVTDSESGEALKNATVQIGSFTTTSAADGTYSFYAAPSGSHTLKATAKGYDDWSADITLPEKGSASQNIAMTKRAMIKLSGKVKLSGVNGNVKDIKVKLSGYTEGETATDANGQFAIDVFKGEESKLTFSYPLFDNSELTISADKATASQELPETTLMRSAIVPYGVTATVAPDGKSATITWKDPQTRDVKTQWAHIGPTDVKKSTSSDYSSSNSDFCVAHAFTAQDAADSLMVGTSIAAVKAWVKANDGTVQAIVWRGTRDDHEVLQSVPMITSSEGGWAVAQLTTPVEVREGENYMVGLRIVGDENAEVGNAGSYTKVTGKNCLKWSETGTTYDGYSGWNIAAQCVIPGSKGEYGEPAVSLPAPKYNIYRTTTPVDPSKTKVIKEGVTGFTVSDDAWGTLAPNAYTYTVKAVYPAGEASVTSAEALSNTVERQTDVDASIEAITSPARTVAMQSGVTVKVMIKNYGEKPLTTVPVKVVLSDEQTLAATYNGNINKGESVEFAVGDVTLKPETAYTITATANVEGDTYADNNSTALQLFNYTDADLRGFRWDPYDYLGVMTIPTNAPETAVYKKEVMPNGYRIATGEYYKGSYYAFTGDGTSFIPREFVVLDTLTWEPTFSTSLNNLVFDVTYSYADHTMYALVIDKEQLVLASIDLATGAQKLLAPIDRKLSTLAADNKGTLFAIANDGCLYTLDKKTGTTTLVGSTSITDIALYHSMTFDHKTGRLFWAHNGDLSSGELLELDPATGKSTFIGKVTYKDYPSHTVGLYIPYDEGTTGITSTLADGTDNKLTVCGNTVSAPAATLFTVTDVAGRTVLSAHASTISLAALPHGLYIVKAEGCDALKVKR